MYGLYRTITPSQSIHSLISGQFNGRDLIVCQRNTCLDFYTLNSDYTPNLCYTFNAYSTLLKVYTYNPPGDFSTTLLLLTVEYDLIALKLTSNEFETKLLVNLQENGAQKIDIDPLLLVDHNYQLIIFYGYKGLLKCILLDKSDYFDFKNLINLKVNFDHIVDLFFTKNLYNSYSFTKKLRQSTSICDTSHLTVDGFADAGDFLRPKRITNLKSINVDKVMLLQLGLVLLVESRGNNSSRRIKIVQLYFEIYQESKKINKSYIVGYGYEKISKSLDVDPSISKILSFPPEGDTQGILFVGSAIIGYKHLKDDAEVCQIHNEHLVAEIECICYKGLQRSLSRTCDDETYLYYFCDVKGSLYIFKISIRNDRGIYYINDKLRNLDTIILLHTISPSSLILAIGDNHIFTASRAGSSTILQICGEKTTEIWNKPSLSPIVDASALSFNYTDLLIAATGMGKSANISSIKIGLSFDKICTINLARVSKIFVVNATNGILLFAITPPESYCFKMIGDSIKLLSKMDEILFAFGYNDTLYQLKTNSLTMSTFDNPEIVNYIWKCDEPIVHYSKCENVLIISSGYKTSALIIDKDNPNKIIHNDIQSINRPISSIALIKNIDKLQLLVTTFSNELLSIDCETKNITNICTITTKSLSCGVSDLIYFKITFINYIFIGLNDGTLIVYSSDFTENAEWQLFLTKKIGDYPIHFKQNKQQLILLCKFIHFVTFSSTDRIVDFIPLQQVQTLSNIEFVSNNFLIIAFADRMELGKISDINCLSVKQIPMPGTVDLVEYHQLSNCIIVAISPTTFDTLIPCNAYIAIYHFDSGELIKKYDLQDNFEGSSLSIFTKGTEKITLIGTSSTENEDLPSKGSILACFYNQGSFEFKPAYKFTENASAQAPNGGVLQIATNKNYVFAGVNHSLVILTPIAQGRSWQGELSPIYVYSEYNMIIGIDVYIDLILITDIISGVKLVKFISDSNGERVEEIAKDIDSSWCTCAKIINQNHVLVSDTEGNATILRINLDPINDEQCYLMTRVAKFNLGECVNKIVAGKFGYYAVSATGAIYEFKFIDLKAFAPLHIFQQSLLKVLTRINRPQQNNLGYRKVGSICNFVDADLLDKVFNLEINVLEEVIKEANEMGCKFNYSFNVSHLLGWKDLHDYDELIMNHDNSMQPYNF